jgi:predicted Zn-dependent peptidase
MLAHILGHHEGSRLYWALVEPGLAEEAQCQFDGRDGCGEFILWHACNPGDAAHCESIVLETLDELIGSLAESDLERVRSLAATAATVAGELLAGRMQRLGQIMTSTGEYRSLDEDLKRILDVTLDDLVELVEAFPIKPMVTGTLGPGGSG